MMKRTTYHGIFWIENNHEIVADAETYGDSRKEVADAMRKERNGWIKANKYICQCLEKGDKLRFRVKRKTFRVIKAEDLDF